MKQLASSERKFGLTVGGALALLGCLALWRGHPLVGAAVGVPGGLLVLAAVLAPRRLSAVERRWMAMAGAVGAFNARVILSLFYYGVVTPVGLVMRLVARDPLDRRLGTGGSYWHRRPSHPDASRERYARMS